MQPSPTPSLAARELEEDLALSLVGNDAKLAKPKRNLQDALCYRSDMDIKDSLNKMGACECFERLRAKTLRLPPGMDSHRANKLEAIFNAVRTSDDKKQLESSNTSSIAVHEIVELLEDRVIARLQAAWPTLTNGNCPKPLIEWKPLTPNSLLNNVNMVCSGKIGKTQVKKENKQFKDEVQVALSDTEILQLPLRPANKSRTIQKGRSPSPNANKKLKVSN